MFTGIIIGLLGLGTIAGILAWARAKSVSLNWYTWLVVALWLVYTLGVIATIGAFIVEGEARAAGTFALIFLIPSVVGLVVLRLLFVSDTRKSAKGVTSSAQAG